MFPGTKQATSASMAVFYITAGALLDVWTTIWYLFFLHQETGDNRHKLFWCTGLFFSGLVLMAIGLAVGRIGRSAREAEVTAGLPAVQQPVVATPPAPAPVNTAGQMVMPTAQPAAPVAPVVAAPPGQVMR